MKKTLSEAESSRGRRFMRLRRGSRRENDDASNALGDAVPQIILRSAIFLIRKGA